MKTTVKLQQNRAVVVCHAQPGAVPIELQTFGLTAMALSLTPDQAAILGEALSLEAIRAGAMHLAAQARV
jgi:hypothetical protein